MGYYTLYKGEVEGPEEFLRVFREDADNDKTFGNYGLLLSEFLDYDELNGGEPMKWYSWQEDMLALSKEYPFLLFTISGEGEDAGDMWRAFIRNGKSYHQDAIITYPDVDVDKVLPIPDVNEAIKMQIQKEIQETNDKLQELQKKLNEVGG